MSSSSNQKLNSSASSVNKVTAAAPSGWASKSPFSGANNKMTPAAATAAPSAWSSKPPTPSVWSSKSPFSATNNKMAPSSSVASSSIGIESSSSLNVASSASSSSSSNGDASSSFPNVVCVRKPDLQSRGYGNFQVWASRPGNEYIGRDMSHYIPGAGASKWGNPFNVKKYGRDECLRLYEEHVRSTPDLWNALHELANKKELGCWCAPEPCHGHVLVKLLQSQSKK